MLLEKGFKLGKYEIEKLLGTGGMGEVYLARDTELNRPAAIKFLSSDFNSDEKLRNRFIQEVRSVSALNHPHILTLYEFGKLETEEKTLHYFVSEFVDGETLHAFLEKEKINLGEILDVVIQTASALVAAHEAGIVHRDIKPENIMLRRDGYVKILDFGLAKPSETDSAIDLEANTKVLTNPGTVMGTVNYMSPEQARGRSVDARTDIWSLGVVFYEMLAGRVPFEGETTSHTIVSILEKQPPPLVKFIQPVPESLQFIIDELLVKDREERCQTAKELLGKLKRLKQQIDAEAELDRSVQPHLLRSTGGEILNSQKPQMTVASIHTTARSGEIENKSGNVSSAEYLVNQITRNKFSVLVAFILGLILVGGITFAAYRLFVNRKSETAENKTPIKLTRITNNGQSFEPVISPDGKNIVFLYKNSGKISLRLRQISTNSFIDLVPEIKGSFLGAAFMPDGNDVYYTAGEKGVRLKSLYKISTLGGEPKKILDDVDSAVSFSPDGKRMVFLRVYPDKKEKVLIVANSDGTGEEQVVRRDMTTSVRDAVWSQDGKTIAFSFYGQDDKGYFVYVESYDLATKTESRITPERWRNIPSICWLPDSRALLIAGRDFASAPASPNQIWKISFPGGEAKKITNDLNDYGKVSIDKNSQFLITGISNLSSGIWVVPGEDMEKARQITARSLSSETLSWTPDGKIIHTGNEGGNNDLWAISSDGSDKQQLTFDEAFETHSAATADGRYIIYETNRKVGWSIWRMNADGSGQTELQGNIGLSFPQITPDSKWIIFAKDDASLWKMPVEAGNPEKIIEDRIYGHKISPDGKYIVYLSVADDLGAPPPLKIIPLSGGQPVKIIDSVVREGTFDWSPDGKAIDFVQNDENGSTLWRISLDGGDPQKVADLKSEHISSFKWSPDGHQLAIASGEYNSDIVLIENFK